MISVATRLKILLYWARAKRFVLPLLGGLLGVVATLLVRRKLAKPKPVDRAATDRILADAIRPHLQKRVEAHQAQAAAELEGAKAAHRKTLEDVAKVQTATPGELEAMLQDYARKVRKVAKLVPLALALWTGSAHAQGMPESMPHPDTAEPGFWLPVDVARGLIEAEVVAESCDEQTSKLHRAIVQLEQAVDVQTDASVANFEALQSTALDLAATQKRETALRAKLDAWYRRPAVLLATGLVLGAAGVTAVAVAF